MKNQNRFRRCWFPAIAALGFAVHMARATENELAILEASGIVRLQDKLIIVCDEDKGTYYEYRIDGLPGFDKLELSDQSRITVVRLVRSALPMDLEGVGVLGDGTVMALSERLNCLVANDHCLTEYDSPHSGYANRGLEGLAVRADPSNPDRSEVAVIWEGGYPVRKDRPNGVRQSEVGRALSPVIIHHTISRSAAGENQSGEHQSGEHQVVSLDMARPNGWIDRERPRGGEPDAYRFRAPDLVWHREGFIVLLSSERSPEGLDLRATERYGLKILQRFDLSGAAIGDPINLDEELCALGAPAAKNWEGLAWFEPGRKLILVFDSRYHPPMVAIVEIPVAWR